MLRRVLVACAVVGVLFGGWYAVAGERSDLVVDGFGTSPQGDASDLFGGNSLEFRGSPADVRVEVTLRVRNDGRHAVTVTYPREIGGEAAPGRTSAHLEGGATAMLVVTVHVRRCPGSDNTSFGFGGLDAHVDQRGRPGRDVELRFPSTVAIVGPTGC